MAYLNKPGTLERTIALSEIQAVLHRYAVLARDNAAWDQMALLLTKDGLYRLPNGTVVKPSEMSTVVQGQEAKYIRHHITSIDVHFTSDNEARSIALYLAVTDKSAPDHWGQWEDVFRRTEDGAWLIADRSIVVDGCDPKGWFGTTYGVPKVVKGTE
ncbi:hypothetical protein H2204_001503 [Knufia peltigerae]|uniref:SnoaL-like domain-containing protein n=1 Tax=Knufia peltigerae TaxID=1002370 RepID=A0AA38YEZ3_9EURO|nr:hypothetical protein H2204_001503 [Knufia peltigerae]